MSREKTWQKVKPALRSLVEKGQRITVAAVAREADLSRGTLYNDRELRNYIRKFEKSFYYSRGKREAAVSPSGDEEGVWARGVLHIDPADRLSKEFVRQKWADLSHIYHPDKRNENNKLRHDLQRVLNEAYEILKRRL